MLFLESDPDFGERIHKSVNIAMDDSNFDIFSIWFALTMFTWTFDARWVGKL